MRIELLTKDKCLNFVEFNITGDNENYNKCDEESLYLNSDIFNLFTHCFEESHQLYEYFGETRYNPKNIIRLQNELVKNLNILQRITTIEKFDNYIKNIFLGENVIEKIGNKDKEWRNHWEDYFNQIVKVNEDLIKLVDRCVIEDRVLWVVGF
ncbi:MAG: hypothetical protein JXB17_11620 [Bacteroidales bacterium]|nr:hypothetical protein [Bacteroidales bacterium]